MGRGDVAYHSSIEMSETHTAQPSSDAIDDLAIYLIQGDWAQVTSYLRRKPNAENLLGDADRRADELDKR